MWSANNMPDQSGRVVVITGANSGVGYESAVALAQKGARVVMACRSVNKAEDAHRELLKRASGAQVDILPLDLGSLKSVREFSENFNARYDRLDILMNNAGIMIPPYGKTEDGFESQFGTNHLGHFALTGLVLPKLLKTPGSRIVNVSSGAYLQATMNFEDLQSENEYNAWGAYAQSKLANILFTQELQRKLDAAGADTISVASHPGFARTNLQKVENNANSQFNLITFLMPIMSQSAQIGAIYQLYAATMPTVRGAEFYGPRWMLKGDVVRVEVTARGKDVNKAARLWAISEELTGVRYTVLEDRMVV